MSYANALVTGASSGLGRGLARALGQRGTYVIAAARRRAALESLLEEIRAGGGSGEVLELDCSDADTTYEVVRTLDARRPLDLVIANAGLGGSTPARHFDWAHAKAILQLNVLGAVATLSAALPGMLERKRGHLVGVASLAGYRGMPKSAAYSASKAALITFLESLRIDLRGSGVDVTSICPGYVKTEMTAGHTGRLPFLLELDDAVALMMRAIEWRRPVCSFPKPLAAAARSASLLPRPVYEWGASRMKVPV